MIPELKRGRLTHDRPLIIVGQPRSSPAQAEAYLRKENSAALAVILGAIEHHQTQDARVRQSQEAREVFRLQPREIGGRLPPQYRPQPFGDHITRRILNRPENRAPSGHLSALWLLPYLDTGRAGVFDAMHALLLGVCKTIVRACIGQGRYKGDQDPITEREGHLGFDSEGSQTDDPFMSDSSVPNNSQSTPSRTRQPQMASVPTIPLSPAQFESIAQAIGEVCYYDLAQSTRD